MIPNLQACYRRDIGFGHCMALGIFALLLGLTPGCMRVSHDTQALRDAILGPEASCCDQQFELGLGTATLGAARLCLQGVEIEPDVRLLLDSVRGVELGIYRCGKKNFARGGTSTHTKADAVMRPRGWERLITAIHGRETVLVYIPSSMHSSKDVKVCIITHREAGLVLVSARSNLDPLLELASRRANQQAMERSFKDF